MTLTEFSLFTDEQKASIVWDGKFLTYRIEQNLMIMLYEVDQFYVEVYYNNLNDRLIGFHPFHPKRRLEHNFEVNLN